MALCVLHACTYLLLPPALLLFQLDSLHVLSALPRLCVLSISDGYLDELPPEVASLSTLKVCAAAKQSSLCCQCLLRPLLPACASF